MKMKLVSSAQAEMLLNKYPCMVLLTMQMLIFQRVNAKLVLARRVATTLVDEAIAAVPLSEKEAAAMDVKLGKLNAHELFVCTEKRSLLAAFNENEEAFIVMLGEAVDSLIDETVEEG